MSINVQLLSVVSPIDLSTMSSFSVPWNNEVAVSIDVPSLWTQHSYPSSSSQPATEPPSTVLLQDPVFSTRPCCDCRRAKRK